VGFRGPSYNAIGNGKLSPMRPLYDGVASTFCRDDGIRCDAPPVSGYSSSPGPDWDYRPTKVLDLKYWLRSKAPGCGVRGRADVSIQWKDDTTA
jgi:hypothetical protein